MAELADAHGSGPCTRKGVGVRVPPSAPNIMVNLVTVYVSIIYKVNPKLCKKHFKAGNVIELKVDRLIL